MGFSLVALDHVQLALPPGAEPEAEAYYVGVLGMHVLPKPPVMAARGGRWFCSDDGVQLHLGAEQGFTPARKAHPALRVDDLDDLAEVLLAAGYRVAWDAEIPGTRRFHTDDPFGNRLEFVAA